MKPDHVLSTQATLQRGKVFLKLLAIAPCVIGAAFVGLRPYLLPGITGQVQGGQMILYQIWYVAFFGSPVLVVYALAVTVTQLWRRQFGWGAVAAVAFLTLLPTAIFIVRWLADGGEIGT